MVNVSNINTFKSIYCAFFHSVIKYGIIYLGKSCSRGKIFILQKKISKIMAVVQPRTSCSAIIDSTCSMPIYSFVNEHHYQQSGKFSSKSIHIINIENKHHLHRPNANIFCFQKSTFYAGIKIFNSLQRSLTILKNEKV